MTDYPESETLTPVVARVLKIADVTTGNPETGFLVRYRGQLYGDSVAAYAQVDEALRPLGITPIFREEKGQHVILLLTGRVTPKPSNPWINLLLFILTLLSMIYTGMMFAYEGPPVNDFQSYLAGLWNSLGGGLAFAVSLLAILLAHEFGHYLAARYHKTHVTLPYFLPFPGSLFGTLGAFIRLKEPPRNKRILLDIGIAGPLAGLVVAIPVLLIGLSLSTVGPISIQPGQTFILEGNSILYLLSKYAVFGQFLPAPTSYDGLAPALYWTRYFFTGQPLPIGGLDVMIHPVAWAGWAGLLVTALNLIPAGQLDGGHVIFVLLGRKARYLLPIILAALVLLGFAWSGWWLWAAIILFLGRVFAEPLDQITRLDARRRRVALFGM
ncbi:MAG TPA: site-2 protease family protein, partial [Anaerolineales bacterium]|nr:site-2 protease family protein [Anaerolineales bacterium]